MRALRLTLGSPKPSMAVLHWEDKSQECLVWRQVGLDRKLQETETPLIMGSLKISHAESWCRGGSLKGTCPPLQGEWGWQTSFWSPHTSLLALDAHPPNSQSAPIPGHQGQAASSTGTTSPHPPGDWHQAWVNTTDEHRCKDSQRNIINLNSAI